VQVRNQALHHQGQEVQTPQEEILRTPQGLQEMCKEIHQELQLCQKG